MKVLQELGHRFAIFLSLLFLLCASVRSIPIANLTELSLTSSSNYPQLSSRGNCFSTSNLPAEVPEVSDLVTKIKCYGNVGNKDSIFYSGFGGGGAIASSLSWYECNRPISSGYRGPVAFDTVVDNTWYLNQGKALINIPGATTQFQRRLSQAFAEASTGTVYFFCPMGKDGRSSTDFPIPSAEGFDGTTWMGYEFPALTRNSAVTEIWQVDPTANPVDPGHVIWTQGDPPSANEPLG
jgi:hypothetical protein